MSTPSDDVPVLRAPRPLADTYNIWSRPLPQFTFTGSQNFVSANYAAANPVVFQVVVFERQIFYGFPLLRTERSNGVAQVLDSVEILE